MEMIDFHFRGVAPALMQADILVNPRHPLSKIMATYTRKKTKTDTDLEEIARIKFLSHLYCDETIGPYWPAANLESMFKSAAMISRRGPAIDRGFAIIDDKIPLIYQGPRSPEELYHNKNFVDERSVVIKKNRIMTYRPIFREWEVKFSVSFDPEILNRKEILKFADNAGQQIGLSNYRPKYGRFEVVSPVN